LANSSTGPRGSVADDVRGETHCLGLDVEQNEGRRRVAEIDVVELQREEAVEAPSREELGRVAVLVEIDIDVRDALEL
jgi:hypothetical protein